MHDRLMGNVAPGYSFAAQAVEVEVDTQTGQVRVLDSFVADDCGKAVKMRRYVEKRAAARASIYQS